MEYNEWLEDVIRLECLLFVKTDIYLLVERKKRSKCLTFSERKQLCVDVFEIFQRLIGVLQTSCPKLTKEDILFCYLFKVGRHDYGPRHGQGREVRDRACESAGLRHQNPGPTQIGRASCRERV